MVLVIGSLAGVVAPARADPRLGAGVKRWGPALDLDVGGAMASGRKGVKLFLRGGAGAFMLDDSQLASITATVSHGEWQPLGFGVTASYARIETGLGLSAGAFRTTREAWGVHGSLSFSLLHLEYQQQFDSRRTRALVLLVRFPVGLFVSNIISAQRAAKRMPPQ